MDNESEVAYVRAVMENLPTLARSPVPGQAAGPKMGKVFGPYNTLVYGIHSERDPVQSNVLRPRNNGRAERWNPAVALQRKPEQETIRKRCREGCRVSFAHAEANA